MSGRKLDTNLAEGKRLGMERKMWVWSVYKCLFKAQDWERSLREDVSSAGPSRNSAKETEKWSEMWEGYSRAEKLFQKGRSEELCQRLQVSQTAWSQRAELEFDSMEVTGDLSKSYYGEDESLTWVGSRDQVRRGTEDRKYIIFWVFLWRVSKKDGS